MGRWKCFAGSPSTISAPAQNVSFLPRQRDTLSDYCVAARLSPRSLTAECAPGAPGAPSASAAAGAPSELHEHLVDIAIRNEPGQRDRDELERHVDTFSDELELEEPTTLWGRLARSVRNGGVLHPQSYWHLAWLLLVSACFVFNCVTIPLRSTFPYQTEANWPLWFASDLACDAVYLLDLVLVKPHLIFVYDGFWVREKRLTRKHYFAKLQFFMDIVSLTPLDILYLKFGKELVLLRLPRILKIQTFWELFDHLDSLLMSPYLVRVARTFCYMMYLVHLNACGYYAFSAREGLGANNWTYKGGEGNAYIRCFYFATKTATSVGKNPRPETEGEYLFMTCSWLMGVFVFALLIGQIRDIVATASRTRNEHRKRLDETLEHMRGLSLPDRVQKRVQSWFTFADQHQPFDEARILNSLPQKLKTDVSINVHGGTLDKVQLFNRIDDPALIRDLVLKLRSVIYLPGDYICRKNEVGKEMYIVKTGKVEVLAPPVENSEEPPPEPTVIATLDEGSVFGEISLLALAGGNRRTADVRSKGFSNLFVLSKNDLHETLVYYPDAQEILKQKAEAMMRENADRERRESRLLRGSPATTPDKAAAAAAPATAIIVFTDDDLDEEDGDEGGGGAGAAAVPVGNDAASRASSRAADRDGGEEAAESTSEHRRLAAVEIRVTAEAGSSPPTEDHSISDSVFAEAHAVRLPSGASLSSAGADAGIRPEDLAYLLDLLPPTSPTSPAPARAAFEPENLAHLQLPTSPPAAGAAFAPEDLARLLDLLPPTSPTPSNRSDPGGDRGVGADAGPEGADGLLPAVRVTVAGAHESPLMSITSTGAARSPGASRSSRASRASRRASRASRRASCSSCGTYTVTGTGTCQCCCCSCSASCSGSGPTGLSTAGTGVAVAWGCGSDDAANAGGEADGGGDPGDVAGCVAGVEHEADTLSDLSSSSLLSPMPSPTLDARHPLPADLERRRVSAPNPVTASEGPDRCLLVPHRLSYPTSRQKQRSLANRTLSHQ